MSKTPFDWRFNFKIQDGRRYLVNNIINNGLRFPLGPPLKMFRKRKSNWCAKIIPKTLISVGRV
jgi:hypothetical protein